MGVVIGAATTASIGGGDYCIISVNWSFNPNVQKLFCIGEWTPREDMVYYKSTETLSMTLYSPGPTYACEASQQCEDANTIEASVSPEACGDTSVGSMDGSWQVNSYSYSKEDAAMPGQESWSLTRWKNLNNAPDTNFIEPDYVLRGMAEGQATDGGTIPAITFDGATVTYTTGSVSAGGFGKADTFTTGTVVSVGGGSATAGDIGSGSASMPYTPLYLGTGGG